MSLLTISSPSVASDGKTYTGTISGGVGSGYGPSSGVTGISVTGGGATQTAATATISGSTLTFTTTNIFSLDMMIKFAISSGSNLTGCIVGDCTEVEPCLHSFRSIIWHRRSRFGSVHSHSRKL